MPHIPEKSDPILWSKYFAMEYNNRAWELSTLSRTGEEDREMLNAAHASAYHWASMEIEENSMRAQMLLAEVHALLGLGDTAYAYASEMLDFFLNTDTPDWEIAFAHTIYAHAAFASGELDIHKTAYRAAEVALSNIQGDEDRIIVKKTFDQVPKPGVSNA